jgi:1-phosphatidylinositol phosphodiesterase
MRDWMSKVKDGTNITKMAIPGTHDSGAYSAWVPPLTRAQDHSIAQQLNIGVRALDVRVGQTNFFNYKVFHGPIDQGITVESVFEDIDKFLDENPSEFVILMLKQETGFMNISTGINNLVNSVLGGKVFPKSAGWPNLLAVRGRVLVLSRLTDPRNDHFDTRQWGRNPTKQELKNVGISNCRIIIQDLFDKPALTAKQKAVKDSLTRARHIQGNKYLFLNFTSFVKVSTDQPYYVGRTQINSWLKTNCRYGKGVVCVDGVNEEIARHIVNMNNIVKVVPVVLNSDTIVGQSCVLCDTTCTQKTTFSSRWHHCTMCHAIYCGSCGSTELEEWSLISRSRKCEFCVSGTELV